MGSIFFSQHSSDQRVGPALSAFSNANINLLYPSPTAGERHAMVTFAQPLVSDVLEIESASNRRHRPSSSHHFLFSPPAAPTAGVGGLSNSFVLSPILAGHPNQQHNANNELLNNSPAVCRICYSGEESGPREGEPLISPCHCKGTMGLYHRTCLNKWLVVSQKTRCEICQFKFELKKTSPSFCSYIRAGHSQSMFGVRIPIRGTILTDFLCFLLLTPLVFLSAFVCFLSGWHLLKRHHHNAKFDGFEGPRTEIAIGIGLFCLTALLVFAYFVWLGVTIYFHHKAFRTWQSRNWNYTVVDQLSMEESMIINGSGARGRRRRRTRRGCCWRCCC